MGGGQKVACSLKGRLIFISAFKAGRDSEDNLTLISILSTGGKKRKRKRKADVWVIGESEREMPEVIVLLSLVFRYTSSCLSP